MVTMLWLYFARNFGKIVGLECPEPLANLYTKSYFRATWVLTALDAGFWTAMPIRRKWLRDICGPLFTVYYLFAAEQADEKVRKVRATVTLDHLRVSWNKSTAPYLKEIASILAPRMGVTPRHIKIARPQESSYDEPINAVLYYTGTRAQLFECRKVVLDFSGGGFVAMSPRNHDDKLGAWARKLGYPIVSIDYKKAPEYPYPYALNECYDAYHSIVYTSGRCVGLSGDFSPRIALTGDSAGGNLVCGVTLMILNTVGTNERFRQQQVRSLPLPDGLVLIYPSLDMNIGSWMTEEQMSLIRDRNTRKVNRNVVRRKSEYFEQTSGIKGLRHSTDSDEEEKSSSLESSAVQKDQIATGAMKKTESMQANTAAENRKATWNVPAAESTNRKVMVTKLATTSRISYFNDRILTPEMMRAMAILYVGPDHRPDFTTDFLLSPIVAPDSLLQMFPKCYFLTGERDPLVDDTVIFAGRLRRAKYDVWRHRKELGTERGEFNEKKFLEVSLIPGISHGFLQMGSVFPAAWREIDKCARWIQDIFTDEAVPDVLWEEGYTPNSPMIVRSSQSDYFGHHKANGHSAKVNGNGKHHVRARTTSMSGDDERPLEIGMSKAVENDDTKTITANGVKRRSPGALHGSNIVENKGEIAHDTRSKSMISLTSEDDLVGRRMEGLAAGLTGTGAGQHE